MACVLVQVVSLPSFSADDGDYNPAGDWRGERTGLIRSGGAIKKTESDPNVSRSVQKYNSNYENTIKESQDLVKKAEEEREAFKKRMDELSPRIEKASKTARSKTWSARGNWFGSLFGSDTDEDVQSAARYAQNELSDLENHQATFLKMYEKRNKIIQENSDKISNELEKKNNNIDAVNRQMRLLKEQLNRSEAFMNLKDLKLDLLDERDKLDLIESKLDQSTIGSYLQTKLGKFMNSKSFCSAAEQCSGKNRKDKANVSQSDFRTEIFGDSTLNPGSSEENKTLETIK